MRNKIAIEPTYYELLSGLNYSKFADAVMDVGPSPCDFHKLSNNLIILHKY